MGGATGNSVGGFAVPKTNPSQLPAKPTGLQPAGGFTQTPTPTGPMHGSPAPGGYGSAGVVPGGTRVGQIGASGDGMNAGGPGSISPVGGGTISGGGSGIGGSTTGPISPNDPRLPVVAGGTISGSTGGAQNTSQPYNPIQPAREYLSRPISAGGVGSLAPGVKTTQPMNPVMNAGGAGSIVPQMKPRDPFAELMALPSVDWNSFNSGG